MVAAIYTGLRKIGRKIGPQPRCVHVWNLSALSGAVIAGVPLEELLFALFYGFMYSNTTEYFFTRISAARDHETSR